MRLTAGGIKAHARSIGFDLCGVAPADALPELRLLREWLARGHAGTMGYLSRTAARREDVRRVLPSARSVIVTGTIYNTDRPYSVGVGDPDQAIISRYAWGDDYHDVLGHRLEMLLQWMRSEHAEPFEARTYVDTGPVQERVYAQYAGIGWVGKNTCLINERLGSWVFLSEIICSLPLDPDPPALDQCGTCALCLEACPTGALVEPRVLDATRCLSYLTIELKGEIPAPLREAVGQRIYGCDICQDVCPWNGSAATSNEAEWQPRPGLDQPRLADLWHRTDRELAELVVGSALTRPKVAGLRRNLAIGLGNSRSAASRSALGDTDRPADSAPSLRDPMVATHIWWAKTRKLD
ncbi:MAG TPA: tRNA epoxyqueuosine(34) reductase QueG [Vicinamibacterales bacterium]|jgi:epoxyqueuosine reductase